MLIFKYKKRNYIKKHVLLKTMFNSAESFNRTWCYEDFKRWKGKTETSDFLGSQGLLFCCPPGQIYNTSKALHGDSAPCEECDQGKYIKVSSIRTTCDKCPRGFTAAAPGTATCGECLDRYFSSVDRKTCSQCGAGEYQFDGIEDSSCKNCAKAEYQDIGGLKECKDCPAGWYQGQEAKPFCLPCIPVSEFFSVEFFFESSRTRSRLFL